MEEIHNLQYSLCLKKQQNKGRN